MNETTYQHRQRARILSAILLAVIMAVGFVALTVKDGPALLPTLFVLTFVQLMMASLNVRVTRKWLDIRFGVGWPRFRFALDRIVAVETVRNAPWWGWGIRLTPRGWLFNVSGLDAVEVEFVDGNRVRIGTDDPQGLAAAIRDALARSHGEDLPPDELVAQPEVFSEETWQTSVVVVEIPEPDFGDAPGSATAGMESLGDAGIDTGRKSADDFPESSGSASDQFPTPASTSPERPRPAQVGLESDSGPWDKPDDETEGPGRPSPSGRQAGAVAEDGVLVDSQAPADVASEAGSTRSRAETDSDFPEPQTDPTGSTTGDSPDASR